jgi:hypothetical protein
VCWALQPSWAGGLPIGTWSATVRELALESGLLRPLSAPAVSGAHNAGSRLRTPSPPTWNTEWCPATCPPGAHTICKVERSDV